MSVVKERLPQAIKCNLCDWARVIPLSEQSGARLIYTNAIACHYVETGHYDSSYPNDATSDMPEPTLHELQVGHAYSKGSADAKKNAAGRMLKIIRSLEIESASK